jgi:hypothetical protein
MQYTNSVLLLCLDVTRTADNACCNMLAVQAHNDKHITDSLLLLLLLLICSLFNTTCTDHSVGRTTRAHNSSSQCTVPVCSDAAYARCHVWLARSWAGLQPQVLQQAAVAAASKAVSAAANVFQQQR